MTVYNDPWYLSAVAPGFSRCNGFAYVLNDRGEAASPYGYPGTGGADLQEVRRMLGKPLFVRHTVDHRGEGPGHPTRVIPLSDPWTKEARDEIRRAEAQHIVARQAGSSREALVRFQSVYRSAMDAKKTSQKYVDLAARLPDWHGNSRVLLIEAERAAALFLLDADGKWAHYHLSARAPQCHNLAMAAIFGLAVEILRTTHTRIHLGSGMSASPDDPLLKFKSRWGKVAHSVYTQEIP